MQNISKQLESISPTSKNTSPSSVLGLVSSHFYSSFRQFYVLLCCCDTTWWGLSGHLWFGDVHSFVSLQWSVSGKCSSDIIPIYELNPYTKPPVCKVNGMDGLLVWIRRRWRSIVPVPIPSRVASHFIPAPELLMLLLFIFCSSTSVLEFTI